MLSTITLFLVYFYSLLLFILTLGVIKLHNCNKKQPYKDISVIVAARNEQNNISNLIESIINQDYPQDKYELIIIDDRSTDKTVQVVSSYHNDIIKLVSIPEKQTSNSSGQKTFPNGKKKALAKGIWTAKHDILAFTDADCLPHTTWLKEINNHFTDQTDFVAGYSPLFINNNNLFIKLKNFERITIFAVSAGSIGWNYGMTCTGRNIAYRKSLYNRSGGFEGIEQIPSGDDDLMLQKMTPWIRKMNFMFNKESFVKSYDKKNFKEQLDQETRRASKWKYYPLPIKIITALVFTYYLNLLYLLIQLVAGNISLSFFLAIIIAKIIAELVLIFTFLVRIKQVNYIVFFLLAELFYIPYFLFFAVKGSIGKYKWK